MRVLSLHKGFAAQTGPRAVRFSDGRGWALTHVLAALACLWLPGAARAEARDVWHLKEEVREAAFSPDGKTLASLSLSDQNSLKLWDVASGKVVATLASDQKDGGMLLAFTSDGKSLVATGNRQMLESERHLGLYLCCAKVWDVATQKIRLNIDFPPGSGIGGVLTPDGKTLIVETWLAGAAQYDLNTGKQVGTIHYDNDATDGIRAMALSPDGKFLALGLKSGTIVLWDMEKNKVSRSIKAFDIPLAALTFSPDGKMVAGAAEDQAELWDVATGAHMHTLDVRRRGHRIECLAFSPDGKTVALVGFMQCVSLWDIDAAGERADFIGEGHRSSVNWVTFSPDGKTLATAGIDKTIRLWDVPQGPPKGVKPRD